MLHFHVSQTFQIFITLKRDCWLIRIFVLVIFLNWLRIFLLLMILLICSAS